METLQPKEMMQALHFPARVAVVIPAWQPPQELLSVAGRLAALGCDAIVVVDDGSSSEYQELFQALQRMPAVHLLRHSNNRGKGCALKTGLGYFLSDLAEYAGVVTADADGQHAVDDIARVATAMVEEPTRLVLGSRQKILQMPLRSRFGNTLTRRVFRAVTGTKVTDTQTGLRGFPRSLVPELLTLAGARYEYEMAVLLHCCRSGRTPVEVSIRMIYTEGNRSSHFHPIRDSLEIYRVLVRSCVSRRIRLGRDAQERLMPGSKIS